MNTLRAYIYVTVAMYLSTAVYGQDLESPVLATVNGEPLYSESVKLISESIEDDELSEGEILEELVNLKLLSNAAREIGLDKRDAIAMAIKLQEDQTLANAYTSYVRSGIEVSDVELRNEYDLQVERLEKQDFRASHIQFDTEEEAIAAMLKLANGADYAELAQAISVSPDGAQGGDLGWFTYGTESFERSEEVEKLEVNNISEPLQTSYGWHIFKVTDTRGVTIPTYNSIKPELQAIVVKAKLKEHLDEIRAEAVVEMLTQ